MRTDSLFYLIFQTAPGILFELIGNSEPRASTYSFASQEVKQTSFGIDGILVPPIYATNLPTQLIQQARQKTIEALKEKKILRIKSQRAATGFALFERNCKTFS